MSANFNVSWSASWNNKKKGEGKRGLTAQEEYWLNRILRGHAKQIFVVIVLFLVLMIVATWVAVKEDNSQTVRRNSGVNITTEVGKNIKTEIIINQ